MHIGFIGLGHMGGAMARALLSAGHHVTAYNRTPDKAEPLREAGAALVREPAEACHGEVVITMLADDAAVEQVVARMPIDLDGTIHVSASTISPLLASRLARRHARFVSAPVLGGPEVAAEGKLFVLAGGESTWIDELAPVFSAIGQRTLVVGDRPEAANLVKLACNAILAAVIESLGETLALVTKSGLVDPGTFVDVALATVLAAPGFQAYGEHLKTYRFEPGFKLPLALNDMELALDAARVHAVPLPLVSLVRDHLLEAIATGLGHSDWTALALVAQHAAGMRTSA
jgi:3-hydroxyisobutyrate dehydrogenase-like beta-hydroxyacid dehydrogenase